MCLTYFSPCVGTRGLVVVWCCFVPFGVHQPYENSAATPIVGCVRGFSVCSAGRLSLAFVGRRRFRFFVVAGQPSDFSPPIIRRGAMIWCGVWTDPVCGLGPPCSDVIKFSLFGRGLLLLASPSHWFGWKNTQAKQIDHCKRNGYRAGACEWSGTISFQ